MKIAATVGAKNTPIERAAGVADRSEGDRLPVVDAPTGVSSWDDGDREKGRGVGQQSTWPGTMAKYSSSRLPNRYVYILGLQAGDRQVHGSSCSLGMEYIGDHRWLNA